MYATGTDVQTDNAVVAPETRVFHAGKARCSSLGSYVNKIITTIRERESQNLSEILKVLLSC